MTDRPFVHLHCHSHYSLLDGASRIPELVARAKDQGMNALALTDHGNLYGAIELYRECTAAGLNPIIGYEAYVAPGKRTEREARRRGEAGFHLTLLARDVTGFRNLVRLASLAFLEGYHYVARIDKELLETHKDGLICLSGCASGEFSELILKDQLAEAADLARWFHGVFGKHFYIEIQNNGLDLQRRCAEAAIDIARRLGLPLVATSDAHYLCQADAAAHDVLLCINTGKLRSDANRLRYGSDQFYVRGPEEMYALFPGHEDAVRRSQEIANGCDIRLDFKARHFPVFTPPGDKDPEDYLRALCEAGLAERYGGTPSPAAVDRLRHELDVICGMGFASYFLIVWDFVRFAQENGIPATARGSACGALVSYVLRLSHVDPLEYDLLFERFLDPSRSEAPDIDIDFCQDRREQVIAYVKRKYGEQSVAQIATFGTLAAKAALRDVGRVLDIPLERVGRLTNLVPKTLGITLDEALQQSPELRQEYDGDSQVRELIDIARKLEGTNRNAGTHAAGVVIANGPLTDYVPLHRVARKGEGGAKQEEAVVTTQWVMGDLEKVGLLKMDFLGLRTLTLLDNAVKLIEKTRGERLDLYKLPLDDPETYALLQRGEARGVFQLESEGIRELLKRMRPDNIRDIIALMALYRPGPLGGGMVDAYINRKHGRERPAYAHPVMEEILAETYGVMVYQEQVMRILNRLGGIELSSAYACIKAISKKKQEIIDQRRSEFLEGAVARGVAEDVARDVFDQITYFGGYGFNKSHTAAYAHVGYQTAYLKANYSPEFMAALLSSEIEDGNKRDIMVEHYEDARRLGCPVQLPNINTDCSDFTVADGKLLFGLVAIKGLGRGAAEEIVRARDEQGPFRGFLDFCERIDLRLVPRAAIERMIKAGAFDCFGARRAQLMDLLPRALQAASEVQQDRRHGQGSLFDTADGTAAAAEDAAEALRDIPEWSSSEKLAYEKEALDFYVSSHPLAHQEEVIRRFSTHAIHDLAGLDANQEVLIGGMLTQIRLQNTKKARNGNSRYLRCKLEDLSGAAECVMWPDDFVRHKDQVQEGHICFVAATVERTREAPGLVITRLMTIDQVQRERTTGLVLALSLKDHDAAHLDAVAQALRRTPGACPVFLSITDAAGKRSLLKTGQEFRVNPATLSKGELEMILGPGRVEFSRQGNGRNGP
jgi:DNA polymerase-3 subunit alpha